MVLLIGKRASTHHSASDRALKIEPPGVTKTAELPESVLSALPDPGLPLNLKLGK